MPFLFNVELCARSPKHFLILGTPAFSLPRWHIVGSLRRPVGVEGLVMRSRETRSRERARRRGCRLMVGCTGDTCPCCGRWVQMVMVVKELASWSRHIPSCCGSGRRSQPETSCCSRRTSSQTGTSGNWRCSGAINETRVATRGTWEGLMVVARHDVALCATRRVDPTACHKLILGVATETKMWPSYYVQPFAFRNVVNEILKKISNPYSV
jgi:hypothetical protein